MESFPTLPPPPPEQGPDSGRGWSSITGGPRGLDVSLELPSFPEGDLRGWTDVGSAPLPSGFTSLCLRFPTRERGQLVDLLNSANTSWNTASDSYGVLLAPTLFMCELIWPSQQ